MPYDKAVDSTKLDENLAKLANAIRSKTGKTDSLTLSQMPTEIEGIQTKTPAVIQPLSVTENGTYTAPDGVDGYSPVTVNVAGAGGTAVLAVAKQTDITSDGTNTYSGETFILLDIYPEPNGTVNVTYDGLTKTVIDTSGATLPEPQRVFFGTFNGVTDSIETPDEGLLTIDGDYRAYANGVYIGDKSSTAWCRCITAVLESGNIKMFPDNAFYNSSIPQFSMPDSVTAISEGAFWNCSALKRMLLSKNITTIGRIAFSDCGNLILYSLPNKLTTIGNMAFNNCKRLNISSIPEGVTTIDSTAFQYCTGLTAITLPKTLDKIDSAAFNGCTGLTTVTFLGTPSTIYSDIFKGCSNLTVINVPWPEGEWETAPWGATNATINYDYVAEEVIE